ncbi:hypothetical protein CIPAW_09G065900 [Carya illinoinensis]|uniref:Uncharacterized protein n=1 Tax=Carya illinoinensis TaxID=32201 RepID=A0A8T1PHV5_CARIL|nr:hypothetical protein CIPAW_09G065900 [Carya illinoinensis]
MEEERLKGEFLKCVTVGDGAVGKTCMLISHTSKTSDYNDLCTTIMMIMFQFNNFSANVVVDRSIVNVGLCDTAGHEDYNRLRPLSYRGADVKAGYENISKKWIPELKHYAPNVTVILGGTKLVVLVDHPGATPITSAQGEELKKMIGAVVLHIECSSKTQQAMFDSAIKVALRPPKPKKKPRKQRTCSFL